MTRTTFRLLFLAAMFGALSPRTEVHARPPDSAPGQAGPVSAQFRGCDAAGWCRFRIEVLDPLGQTLHTIYPDGMPDTAGDRELAVAVRDRLNALMSSFVHQHKRIMLYGLRARGDGTWAASITVNESALEDDPALRELGAR